MYCEIRQNWIDASDLWAQSDDEPILISSISSLRPEVIHLAFQLHLFFILRSVSTVLAVLSDDGLTLYGAYHFASLVFPLILH